jgi:transcriptional regulator with XRE-family HTH domain
MSRLNDLVRERLREELQRKDWSQRDIADLLQWSQSRVAKLLAGRVEFSLNELEAFCTMLHLRPTEVVRDRSLEFSREMTPSDLRVFETMDRNPRVRAIIHDLVQLPLAAVRDTRRTPKTVKASLARTGTPKG